MNTPTDSDRELAERIVKNIRGKTTDWEIDETAQIIAQGRETKPVEPEKPSGFRIAISDSFCTWEYPLAISSEHSINEVHETICAAFFTEPQKGKLIEEPETQSRAVKESLTTAIEGMPDGLPEPPAPPDGMRWVYRGKGWASENKCIYAFHTHSNKRWDVQNPPQRTNACNGYYLEAVPIEPMKEADAYAELKAAHARGETIQVLVTNLGGWNDVIAPSFDLQPKRYRIKPTPKLVPLCAEDLPPVCWIRHGICTEDNFLATTISPYGIVIFSNSGKALVRSWYELFDGYEYSEDRKIWKPCNKEATSDKTPANP